MSRLSRFRGRFSKNESGFVGLTELMIIIAIIGILTAMSNPAFRFLRQRAREAVALQDMGNVLRPGIEQYRLITGEFPAHAVRYSLITSTMGSLYTAGTTAYSKWLGGLPYLMGEQGVPPNPDNDIWREDPWGQPYYLLCSGSASCVVLSGGPDGSLDSLTSTVSSTQPSKTTGRFSGSDDLGVVIAGYD